MSEHADPSRTTPENEGPSLATAPGTAFPLPTRIGRYRVERMLGEGGFGLVYLAHDDQLQRPVAVKVPHSKLISRPEDAEAYLTEARTVAKLDHPNIVPVHDVGGTEQFPCFIVSKYIDGTDLAKRLKQVRFSIHETVELIATVAESLRYAHKQGLVHRDIKTGNILLDKNGKAFVADFGLALREQDVGKGPRYAGTPAYMSPEQARGEGHRVDGRSDIFSLGVVFYELMTGRRPFLADSRGELLEQITNSEVRPPRQWDDTIPKELERICLKSLSKRASERYNTAKDLADDLRHFLNQQPSPAPHSSGTPTIVPVVQPASTVAGSGTAVTPKTPTSDYQPIKIVPKGLRSFDSHDADFFLELLPGPRDREGLPDSIRFWKTLVEETDIDNTFAVGLIYGPSGCGKSSLVKAGLLPRLSDSVMAVYVEATAGETESRLLHGLRKRCPGLHDNMTLKETMTTLRRGHGLPAGKKVLIVLDQFEQLLHAKKEEENTELVHALRHCDGSRVQCIVLVRDDFWMAVTRFLTELEVELLHGRNIAAVDLFNLRHATKVLTAFGQAFGALPENSKEITRFQQEFLRQAISGLAQDGKVICVRLALFAEMMKGKAWTPATLTEVGGTEGVGVTFLEDTFSSSTANPKHRLHQKAARTVLKALLPESGTDMKGHMRSQQELLDASGYGSRLKDFDDLLHILDRELRLITPTDPVGRENSEPATLQTGAKYYQLTHDYLVPSLRDWLTRKQRETSGGRAQLRLAERAAMWTSKPQNRYLPAWWEWANIRLLTRRKDWTVPQKKMMHQANRFHAVRGGVLAVALIVLSMLGYESLGRLEAQHLRDQLLSAKIDDVPAIVGTMDSYRRWAQPDLQQALVAADNQDPARQLRLRLALSRHDDSQFDPLYERLFVADPEELAVIRGELKKRRPEILAEKLRQVLDSDKAMPEARLRAACALAGCDTLGEDGQAGYWLATAPFIVDQLLTAVQKNPSHYRPMVELLRPVSNELVTSVATAYGAKKRPDADRALAASLLTEYASDRPEMLANLLLDGSPTQFGILFDKLRNENVTVRNIWTAELARQPSTSASADVRDGLAQRQANAAVALLRTGHGELVWPLLKHRPDPTVRSYLTNRFATMGADPEDLVKQLSAEPDVTVRRALLLSLGDYRLEALPAPGREAWPRQIAVILRVDPDPGVHGAAEWLLRRWQQEVAIQQHKDAWAKDAKRREEKQIQIQEALVRDGNTASPAWYVNGEGQTMVVLPDSGEFMMGSPKNEAGHFPDEAAHQQRIGRSFAIMDTSVTVEQFERFLSAHPETRKAFSARAGVEDLKKYSPEARCPMMVTWFMAAEYCNWLSAQEGIPREQWCYEPNTVPSAIVLGRCVAFLGEPSQYGPLLALGSVMLQRTLSGDYSEGMKLSRDYLHRTGYRFPTEAEWEYACRALAASRFHFGEPAVLLDRYARFNANSADRTWPVAGLKPNDWGLFDMHGNMFTWCLDRYGEYAAEGGRFVGDNENAEDLKGIHNKDYRVLRGGAFISRALDLRSAFRERLAPGSRRIYVGFRPARTLP